MYLYTNVMSLTDLSANFFLISFILESLATWHGL